MKIAAALPDRPPLADTMPALAERLRKLGGDPTVSTRPRVYATRSLAHEVIATQSQAPAILDFEGVDCASPSFVDELVKAWPKASATGMNEDVADVWDLVQERRSGSDA